MGEISRQPEEEKPKEINDAQNYEELYSILDEKGKILGGHREYSAEELKQRIDAVLHDFHMHAVDSDTDPLEHMQLAKKGLESITRSEGLRDKVSELMYKDVEEMIDHINKTRK